MAQLTCGTINPEKVPKGLQQHYTIWGPQDIKEWALKQERTGEVIFQAASRCSPSSCSEKQESETPFWGSLKKKKKKD